MQALSEQDLQQHLRLLDQWSLRDNALSREFVFKDFAQAFQFMSAVAQAAESQSHHPEWSNVYNRVNITLTTHAAGRRVSVRDIALAKVIDTMFADIIQPSHA